MYEHYALTQSLLEDTRAFLSGCGQLGYEGVVVWIGCPAPRGILLMRVLIPDQICTRSPAGLSVELTPEAHYTLTDHLNPGEQLYARVHSHPGRAYHSTRDDANPLLTHEGAISIVVPFFAADLIILRRCAVYRLQHGLGWRRLNASQIDRMFEVIA